MTSQAEDGHEFETELKLVITSSQYDNLLSFISTHGYLDMGAKKLTISDFQTKEREYRDYDTKSADLLKNGCSLTARKRESDFAITAKFPAHKKYSRYEINASIRAESRDFYSIDFLSLQVDPVTEVKKSFGGDLEEVLRRRVITNRANLSIGSQNIAELAIDKVIVNATIGSTKKEFYELEIEGKSEECDISWIRKALAQKFGEMPNADYTSKYEKARKLLGL